MACDILQGVVEVASEPVNGVSLRVDKPLDILLRRQDILADFLTTASYLIILASLGFHKLSKIGNIFLTVAAKM